MRHSAAKDAGPESPFPRAEPPREGRKKPKLEASVFEVQGSLFSSSTVQGADRFSLVRISATFSVVTAGALLPHS